MTSPPRVPASHTPAVNTTLCGSELEGRVVADRLDDVGPATVQKQVSSFLVTKLNVLRHFRDEMTDSQDK